MRITLRISVLIAAMLCACQPDTGDAPDAAATLQNPFLARGAETAGGRATSRPNEGVAAGVGPVTALQHFRLGNEYIFAPGDQFHVDVALPANNGIVVFLSGTHWVVAKGDGEALRPDEVVEAFVTDGVLYLWGSRNGEPFTWTIDYQEGVNGLGMEAGHVGKRPLILETTITTVAPTAQFTNNTSMTISFAANTDDATFECSLNGGPYSPCSSPVVYEGLADGPYNFHVRSRMGDQVDETGASHDWTVDTVPPFITFISSTTTSTIQVDWTTSEPTTSYLEWGLNPMPENLIPESSEFQSNHTYLLAGLRSATVYYFFIGGRDRAGNTFRSSRFSSATRR